MMLAWRTTLFTVKGLRQFMKDGFEKSAKHFDARCGGGAPSGRVWSGPCPLLLAHPPPFARQRNSDLEVDLKGRCALVTGANQGIGYQTATALAKRGARSLL